MTTEQNRVDERHTLLAVAEAPTAPEIGLQAQPKEEVGADAGVGPLAELDDSEVAVEGCAFSRETILRLIDWIQDV